MVTKTSKWQVIAITTMVLVATLLSIVAGGCFTRSSNESTGSSVPAPGAFDLGIPADMTASIDLSGSVSSTGLPMTWAASANVATYLLAISKDDSFAAGYSVYSPSAFASNITEHYVSTASLTANTLYYWRVTAANSSGSVMASDAPFNFYTGTDAFAPGAFDLSSPLNSPSGAISAASPNVESLTPELVWTNATTETLYTIYVATDTSFTSPYTTTTKAGVLSVDIPVSAGLTDTARYYWKVDANGYISSTASTTPYYSFITGTVKYYDITADTSVIGAGDGITATVTAYGNANTQVTSHTPFSITMNAGTGFTYYTNNTFTTVNATREYTVTGGVATVYVKIIGVGSPTLTLTDALARTKTSSAITVGSGTATKLLVTTQPVTTVAGTTMANVVVTVQDAYDNTVTSADTVITLTPSAGTLYGAVSVTASSGVATFNAISMTLVGADYTFTTSNNGSLTNDTSAAFDIIPAAASKLVFSTQPINTVAGATMADVVVVVADAYNNLVPSAGTVITLTPSAGTLYGAVSITASSGVATFNAISMTLVGAGYTFTTTNNGSLTNVTSNAFNITFAATNKLAFTTEPVTTVAGVTMANVVVTVQDAFSNTVTSAGTVITLTPSAGTLYGAVSVTASSGVATFNAISMTLVGAGYTLTTTNNGSLTNATSIAFDITIATASKLAFTTQPVSTVAGATMANVVVNVKDQYNNNISGQNVTLALSPTGVTTLAGTLTQATDVSGNATFNNLVITLTGTYALTATAGSVITASANFNITAAAIDNYLVTPTIPMGITVANLVITQTGTVTARDIYNNTVTTAGTTLTMSDIDISGTPAVTYYVDDEGSSSDATYGPAGWSNGLMAIYWRITSGVDTDATTLRATDDGAPAKTGTSATITITTTGRAPVDLGTAGNFVILAKSGVSAGGATTVLGDIGVSPAAAGTITGFGLVLDISGQFATSTLVTGTIYAANYTDPTPATLTTAVGNMQTAYTDAAGRTLPDFTELYAGNISGKTLVPGLYKWSSGVQIDVGGAVTLTGNATDVWIFQIAQDLLVGNSTMVNLVGGALPENVFWQVAGQTTLGTTSNFKGIILCQTLIAIQNGATFKGRALAQTAVTLDATTFTAP